MKTNKLLTLGAIAISFLTAVGTIAFAAPTQNEKFGIPALNLLTIIDDDLFSTADLTTLVASIDPTTAATQHYGPYASGSTDSGTCGNDWANDLFDRHFTVFGKPGSFTIVEQFKDGTFTTPASDSLPINFSPGACQNGTRLSLYAPLRIAVKVIILSAAYDCVVE